MRNGKCLFTLMSEHKLKTDLETTKELTSVARPDQRVILDEGKLASELIQSWKLYGESTGEWTSSKLGDITMTVKVNKIEENAMSVTFPMRTGPELR